MKKKEVKIIQKDPNGGLLRFPQRCNQSKFISSFTILLIELKSNKFQVSKYPTLTAYELTRVLLFY